MNYYKVYNDGVTEFTILEDYKKEKYVGKKKMEVEPGVMEVVKQYKEILKSGKPSKMIIYNSDIRQIRQVRDRNLKTCKNKCVIKLVSGDNYMIKGKYNEIANLIFNSEKNRKIGF